VERFVVLGVVFVATVLISFVLVQIGVVRNPVTLGLVVTGTGFLLMLAHFLEKIGVLSGEALGIFFVIALGIFLTLYGFTVMGALPAMASGEEGLMFTASMYTLLVLLFVLVVYLLAKTARQQA